MLSKIGIILFAAISTTAIAEIYQWTDEKGITHYSDAIPKTGKTKDGIQLRDNNLPNLTTVQHSEAQARQEKEQTSPTFIEISDHTAGVNCNSTNLNSIDRNNVLDAWQDREWRDCHGMKEQ